jgi:hypothetical protein
MASPAPPAVRLETLAGLRAALAARHRAATPDAFTPGVAGLVRSAFPELDAALGGGFPRGIIATLEGQPGSGRSSVAMRLLAYATAGGGLGALIETPDGPDGTLYAPALAAAGVALGRLLVVRVSDRTGVARAADIVLRAAAFGVVVIPAVALHAAAWTRLASLAHHANALLIALGAEATDELRYFASLRIRMQPVRVCFAGPGGLFGALAGIEAEAAILKHKRAAPGKRAGIACSTFETDGAPLAAVRVTHVAETPFEAAPAPLRAGA